MSGTIAFLLFVSVKRLILDHEDTFARAKKYVPYYMWLVGFMISMVTLLKGLKHIGVEIDLGMGVQVRQCDGPIRHDWCLH